MRRIYVLCGCFWLLSLAQLGGCGSSSGGGSHGNTENLEFDFASKSTVGSWDVLVFSGKTTEALADMLTKQAGGLSVKIVGSGAETSAYVSSVEFNQAHKMTLNQDEAKFSAGVLVFEKRYEEPGDGVSHDPEIPTDKTYDEWLLPWSEKPEETAYVKINVPEGTSPEGYPKELKIQLTLIPW
jgi:hypothetical protein